ncbi:MAG: site-specific integrase, partial [Candidatus Nanohaloarchaea archaeon]|nr:site-specific integrase [Candidatus Nanohaloarchaea archaeon]
KLLRHAVRAAEKVGGLADALEDREAAEDIVRWIHREYDREDRAETNRDYRVALRVFGKRVTDGDDPPDSLAWISAKLPRSYDP